RDVLGDALERRRDVGVALVERTLGGARRAEERLERGRHPSRPAAEMIREVAEVEREAPALVPAQDALEDRIDALGGAVRRGPHPVPSAAPGGAPEALRKRGVEEPAGVRDPEGGGADEARPLPRPEPRRDVLAGAVDRQDRGLLERREVERARGVRRVML